MTAKTKKSFPIMKKKRKKKLKNQLKNQESPMNQQLKGIFAKGDEFHSQGDFHQAYAAYRSVLTLDPENPDANHLLGIIRNETGNPKLAITLIRKAIERKPGVAKFYNSLGEAYRADSRKTEAYVNFKKAISFDEKYLDPHLNMGHLYLEDEEFDEANDSFKNGLTLDPGNHHIQTKLALVYLEQGDIENTLRTLDHLKDSLSQHHKDLLNEDFLLIDTTSGEASDLFKIGLILSIFDEFPYAALCMAKSIEADPDFMPGYAFFSDIVNSNPITTKSFKHGDLIEEATLQCLLRNDINHNNLRSQVSAIIDINEMVGAINQFVGIAPPEKALDFLLSNKKLNNLLSNPCLLMILKSTTMNNFIVENLLTSVRKCLLITLSATNDLSTILESTILSQLVYTIAYQCFLNEYVYYVEDDEKVALTQLENLTIEKLTIDDPEGNLYAAMVSCYVPLENSIAIKELLTTKMPEKPSEIEGIIKLQITNQETEKALSSTIKRFKPIDDDTSKLVRQQYEENPYPRWSSIFQLPPKKADLVIKKAVDPNLVEDLSIVEHPSILIAGCGTGQQPISVALNVKNSTVLAIDLSLASMSYAKRQAQELDIKNIEFMHADILDLGTLDQRFDIIECAGVLHHMQDPLAGWKVLEGLLKPNGLMKIGLYSELARKTVVAARSFIAERGFESTPEGIKECRKTIQAMPDGNLIKSIANSSDFYSTSTVRDLIFHSMEHRFGIPEIEDALTALDLEFLGFTSLDSNYKAEYLRQFPNDTTATSLTNWHIYETQHPKVFSGMYQFWLRKKENRNPN